MSNSFHDINLPGRSSSKKEQQPEKRLITGVDESELESEPPEPELRLISSEWKAGPRGFQHNEQCFLEVKAEYLKKTIRSRIRGELFGVYDGQEVNLNQEVYGHVEKDGIAMMDIEHLWFVNHSHYHAWQKDKSVPSSYMIKKIQHSRGVNMIDSPVLEMPQQEGQIVSVYFEDRSGNRIEITSPDQVVFLIIETMGLGGQTVDIDLSDAHYDYEYDGKVLENDILRDFGITSDTMRIELKTLRGREQNG